MPDEQEELTGVSFEDNASPSETPTEQAPEPYSNQFFNSEQWINSVPEQDRPIVQKYVKDVFSGWDAGVNKALEERAKRIKEYEQFGELEEIRKAAGLYNGFRTNGDAVLGKMLKSYFETYGAEAGARLMQNMGYEMPTQQEPQENEWDYSQGEPDPDEIFKQNVQSELEELRAFREEIKREREEAQATQQLDALFEQVHTARPDIPEKFLLQGIASGDKIENVISLFDELTKGNVSSQQPRKNPPIVMGGQGGVPSGQVDVSKLDKQQRLQYMQQMLEASGQ